MWKNIALCKASNDSSNFLYAVFGTQKNIIQAYEEEDNVIKDVNKHYLI